MLVKHFFATSVKIYFVKMFIFLLLRIMFFCHIHLLYTVVFRMMLVDSMSKYKTIHTRKEESEEGQFVDLLFSVAVYSVMVTNT